MTAPQLVSQQASCSLCDELLRGARVPGLPPHFTRQVVAIDASVVLLPSLGPVSEHHLLLMPLEHTSCTLQRDATRQRVAQIADAWIEWAGSGALVFEHANALTGCGVTHAHAHLLTCKANTSTLFSDLDLSSATPTSIAAMSEELFWCLDERRQFEVAVGALTSQFARYQVAKANELSFSPDWRAYTHLPYLIESQRAAHEFAATVRQRLC